MSRFTRINFCCLYFLLACWCGPSTILQANHVVTQEKPAQKKSTQNNQSAIDGAGLSIESLTVSPQARAVPGSVLILRSIVINSGNETAISYLVSRIEGQTGEEDRRRIELAAGETKSYDIQLRLAKGFSKPMVDIVATLNVVEGGREVMVQRGDEPITRTLTLQVLRESNITGVVMDAEPPMSNYWEWPETKPYFTYELAVASRIDASFTRQCVVLDSEPLPLNIADWQSINLLIVANPIAFEDVASVAAVKQFLQSGGRVWIMLDRIDTAAIGDLLSSNQQIETVSMVDLNRFEVDDIGLSLAAEDRTMDRDDFVQMKRVIQEGGQVTHWIDGWPAAIWMPVGRGKLLLTTLSSAGWIEPRKTQKSLDPVEQSSYTMPIWASGFANEVHNPKSQRPLNLAQETYPIDRIGNPVVSRSLVAFVLLAFCLCLIAFGVWQAFGGGFNRLGIVAPTLALVASIPLIVAAQLQRREIPSMVSALQLVQVESATGAYLRESGAVYSSESRSMELVGKGDGLAIPSSAIDTGIRSLTTDDFQQWRLTNNAWPAGTWRYTSQIALPEVSIVADAELTKDGLSIELPANLPSPLEDVVVGMVAGAPSIGKLIDNDKRLLIDGELPAGGDRWTSDTIVSDEQRRRADLYAKMFESPEEYQLPLRTVCGWTKLWPEAPQWNVDFERRGTALVAIPIRLATPSRGSQIRIPYPLVRIEHANIIKASSVFRADIGKFISEATLATETDLAFVLPPEIVPFEAQSVSIDWDIKAPSRTARLLCISDDGPVELVSLNEPSIPWKNKIDDPRVLKDLRDGRLMLRIEISGGAELENATSSFVSWQIKHLRVSVDGRTLPRHSLVTSTTN